MSNLGLPVTAGVSLPEHLEWLDRSVATLPDADDPVLGVYVLGKVAMVQLSVGHHGWRAAVARMAALAGGAARQRREVGAFYSIALAACEAGHYRVADRYFGLAQAGAATCGSRRYQLGVRSARALLDYRRGSWLGLRDPVEALACELADYPVGRLEAELVAANLVLAYGDVEGAQRRVAKVVEWTELLGDHLLMPAVVSSAIRAQLAGENGVDGAVARADRLVGCFPPAQLWAPLVRALPALAQAWVAGGEVDRAGQFVELCAGQLRGLDAPLAPAVLSHARAVVAAGAGRLPDAARRFTAAARHYHRLDCPYEEAQAHEQAAQSGFELSDQQAEAAVLAALAGYEKLGASWDLARCARMARRHGMSLPSPYRGGRRGYGDALSPRERQVAQLAAAGRTNQEIAAELFLSANTVKKHLSGAMRKLGVSTRRALAAATGPEQR